MTGWRGCGRDDGAVTAEYAAMLLLVAALVLALLLSGISPAIADAARHALCQIFTDGPCPTAPSEPQALNRMGLPCLTYRNTADWGYSLLATGRQVDGYGGYAVEQLGTGTFRVTLYGETAGGAGTLFGDGPGSLGRNGSLLTGKYGSGSATLGGRVSTSYDFETREEADAFAQGQRGGYKQWLHTAGGAPVHLYTQAWEWVKRQVTGDEAEPSFTSTQVIPRAGGRIGYNAGVAGVSAHARGAASAVHTKIRLNGWSVYTESLDGGAGAGLSILNLSAGIERGVARRRRVIFDEHDRPLRYVEVVEHDRTEHLGADIAGVRSLGDDRGFGAGGGPGYSEAPIHIREYNLDLRDPANRRAFDDVFTHVPGYIARPRRAVGEEGWTALDARMRADGVVVDLRYSDTAQSVGGGDVYVGRGLFGVLGSAEWIERELTAATIVDPRWANPAPQRFEACWTDQGGAGVPAGLGAPGEGAGQ